MTFDDHLSTSRALCTRLKHGHSGAIYGSFESDSTTHTKENARLESPGPDIYAAREQQRGLFVLHNSYTSGLGTLVLFSDHKDQLEHTSVTRRSSAVTSCRHLCLCLITLCPSSNQDVTVRDLPSPTAQTEDSEMASDTKTPQHNSIGMSKPSWKSLFGFTTRKHLPTLAVGAGAAFLAGCVTPALAIFLGNVFDLFTSFGAGQMQSDTLMSQIVMNCLGMVGLGAAGWLLNGAYFGIFVAFGEIQAWDIRRMVLVSLLKRDIEWFEAQHEGSGAFLSGIQA